MGEVTPLPLDSAICCDVGAAKAFAESDDAPALAAAAAPLVEARSDGTAELSLAIENLQCSACLPKIEGALRRHAGLVEGRVNLTLRRLKLAWRPEQVALVELLRAVLKEGYRVAPFDHRRRDKLLEEERKGLLRALAVAGFAAGNVMLFSVSVWAGLVSDMSAVTRQFMNWVAAAIALPAVAYAVRPFLRSAITVLKAGRLNMDVPITLAVLLATGMSLFQVMQGGERVYFDAALSLLFFLLIGRYLDLLLRGRARSAAENLLALQVESAERIEGDGTRRSVALSLLKVGERVAVAPGQRLPVDGVILGGQSELDVSLITGESLPEAVGPGSAVRAGTLNLSAELIVQVRTLGEGTLLAEIVRLVEAAEQGRARSIRLADRMARFYAPAVHILAAVTFVGSYLLAALSPELSLLNAIAVLIVTCPCAIGLAVPAVQVAAVGRLLKRGILVKEADALERLAVVDHVVFDKTGTLTQGKPEATNLATIAPADRRLAAQLAAASHHPLARALVRAEGPVALPAAPVHELPGQGLMTELEGVTVKLGSAAFVGAPNDPGDGQMELWLRRGQAAPLRFTFADQLRPDAQATVEALRARGLTLEILSGDRAPAVAEVAGRLGIAEWQGGLSPKDKADRLAELRAAGRRVLMVGDGLNDAAALSGALVSLSPSDAIGISQNAADAIFQGASLKPIAEALCVARRARRLVRQNFSFALAYNLCAVPLAMAGLVTPLLAAIFMSSSSLIVTLNAARLVR